ncbi:MAG: hypothetical protein JRH01_17430 [Deltaproteobacteria bacterium]|nr:hypothetical protein [Deltaproteobacteria bacterium]MBW2396159.1 hypothetical protein [Deltaproteobacteria bacterium]
MVGWFALAATAAHAIDLWDRKVQVHGFYEFQVRAIANDLNAADDFDVSQMAHVLNLEIEADLAPDGFGPFDAVSAFTRIEARYDCVWTRACGLFPSVNAYGDGAKRYPKRVLNGRRFGYVGGVYDGDIRRWRADPIETFSYAFKDRPEESRVPLGIEHTEAFWTLFTSPGADQELGTADDPSPFYFDRYFQSGRCKFAVQRTRSYTDGVGVYNLGPMDPDCDIEPIAAFADKPNPFRARDINPLTGGGGSGELPFRPAPELAYTSRAPDWEARGLWIPNPELRRMLRDGDLDDPPLNFDQNDLAWNHGASQGFEKELKEIYLDLEMLDNRLWVRAGKQTIVWGKTELFRNQDQFNPQDLALSSLPGLEESRTALWALRAVYSFYDVGPLHDMNLEVSFNFDDVEGADLGRCGEPYTVLLVCAGTFGFLAHGFEAKGLAGQRKPPSPWNSWHGLEVGARLQFRWNRFSFALTDFYGYDDLPYLEKLYTFERNVDPKTGRPRRENTREGCRTGSEDGCLRGGKDALLHHSSNQTLFAKNCASTFGIVALDPTACGLTVFNSQVATDPTEPLAPRLMIAFNNMWAGSNSGFFGVHGGGAEVFAGLAAFNARTVADLARFPWTPTILGFGPSAGDQTPLVALSVDPNDGGPSVTPPEFASDPGVLLWQSSALQPVLTDQQEALLGCGVFFDTQCDIDGIDLFNAEASAIMQSFVGFDGTAGDWSTTDRSRAQPGTVGFEGGPVCTRYEGGRLYILPGCRGPGEDGYSLLVDGSTGGGVHPFTGQPFRTEMAIFSWNFMMVLAANSLPKDPKRPRIDEFDPNRAFRSDGCSLAKPQFCNAFNSFWQSVSSKRPSRRAGGNGRFGRRDFQWHDGTPIVVRFQKRNVLGFSMDFAEDVSKSNWAIEFTWTDDILQADNNEFDGLSEVDAFNLTVSVDRSTFINFLNANRTFFFNTQVFVRYVSGYRQGFTSNGPWSTLATFTATTGYFQDRLNPSMTLVWDLGSDSGAALGQVQYRFSSNFSATFGVALFAGRTQRKDMGINPIASRNRTGRGASKDFVDNGLSVIRDRDEFFVRVRYSF